MKKGILFLLLISVFVLSSCTEEEKIYTTDFIENNEMNTSDEIKATINMFIEKINAQNSEELLNSLHESSDYSMIQFQFTDTLSTFLSYTETHQIREAMDTFYYESTLKDGEKISDGSYVLFSSDNQLEIRITDNNYGDLKYTSLTTVKYEINDQDEITCSYTMYFERFDEDNNVEKSTFVYKEMISAKEFKNITVSDPDDYSYYYENIETKDFIWVTQIDVTPETPTKTIYNNELDLSKEIYPQLETIASEFGYTIINKD